MHRIALVAFFTLALFAAGPAPAQPRHTGSEQWYNFTKDGHRQYVYEMGRAAAPGDTVVVLHGGWGAEHGSLLEPMALFADRYRIVLYDQRGSLLSPAPDSTLTLDRLVADLDDLREALGLRRMTLVAHSMRSALAYAYLAQHPDRVKGLVLMGPVLPEPSAPGASVDFLREVWPQADTAALRRTKQAFFDGAFARAKAESLRQGLVPDSLRNVPPDSLDLLSVLTDRAYSRAWRISFAMVNTCSGQNWREMPGGMAFYKPVGRAIMRGDGYAARTAGFWPALRRFSGPVRVVIGTCDYVDVGPLVWPRVLEHLPDGRITIVEGAGHALWMDRREEFRKALADALSQTTR